jgi:hypothetical protein
VCAYFPYLVKVWVNGHKRKRQATQAGIEFTQLSNGLATSTDPDGLQAICDRLGPGTISVFFERWVSILPQPLTRADRALRPDLQYRSPASRGTSACGGRRSTDR